MMAYILTEEIHPIIYKTEIIGRLDAPTTSAIAES